MRTSLVAAALLGAFAFGCSSTTKGGAGPDGGTTPGSDGGATPAATALTCGGIFDCATKCEEAGTPCDDACLAKGSPAGRDAVNGLVACSETNRCADGTCLQTNCKTELTACVQSAGSSAKPLEGSAPAGNVPAELIAVWKGLEESLEFRADGTVGRSLRIRAATCTYEAIDNGTAVVDAATITLYFTSGSFKDCTGPDTDPYKPTSETFTYSLTSYTANTVLRLEKQNCAPGGICVSSYDKH